LLGARIVVLLKEVSELPLVPIHTRSEAEPLGEEARLEVEYGLALIGYMLEVARGFYDNTISLEGRTSKTSILLVEFWWWLHRKAEYVMRGDYDRKRSGMRIPGGDFVGYRKILRDANIWSDYTLFNHLAYAAMRCSDQGFVTLDQLLSSVELGPQLNEQQVARYKEAALVQQGPARDAFVATVSQQLANKLLDCRQFIRGEKAKLGFKAPTASPTNLSADKQSSGAEQIMVGTAPAPVTPDSRVGRVRRSTRIAAARSMTVVAADIATNNVEPEPARELMLLARACATNEKEAEDDKNLGSQEGKDSDPCSKSYQNVVKSSHLRTTGGDVIKGQFYEYPQKIVALLELGYLTELEQGVFIRFPDSSERELHPDLSKLARRLQEEQQTQETFNLLPDNCLLFALENGIFCDGTFQQTTQTQETSNKNGEEPKIGTPPIAIHNRAQFTRDACLAVVELGPQSNYDYPPMLEALVQLGFLFEYDNGVFKCLHDCNDRGPYHRTTAAKRMQRHFLAAELLYI
jgi:hypothetical protein